MGDDIEGPTTMLNFGESETKGDPKGLADGLFLRVPTDAEKRYYVSQWGGYHAGRVLAWGMAMFALGVILGFSIAHAP